MKCTGTPAYVTGERMRQYLEDYVNHFGLRPRFQLNTAVSKITREKQTRKWRVDFAKEPSKYFDRVVMAIGPHVQASKPDLPGAEEFAGQILHSQAFKR